MVTGGRLVGCDLSEVMCSESCTLIRIYWSWTLIALSVEANRKIEQRESLDRSLKSAGSRLSGSALHQLSSVVCMTFKNCTHKRAEFFCQWPDAVIK